MVEEVDPTAAAAAYTKPKVIITIFMSVMHKTQHSLQYKCIYYFRHL